MFTTEFLRPLRAATVALVVAAVLSGPAAAQAPSPSGDPADPVATADPSSPPTATPFAAVPGSSWAVRAYDADTEGLVEPRRNGRVTMELLDGGRLQGETDCGTYLGGYVLDGTGIGLDVIDTGAESCGPRRRDEVVAYVMALEASISWASTPTGLALFDPEGFIRVELEPVTRGGLEGGWLVTAIAASDGELLLVPAGTPVSLDIQEGGRLSGSTGCRLFDGEYLSEADQVLLVPSDTTGLPCEGDQKAVEERLFGALEGVILWERSGDDLRLTDSVGNVLIELVATAG